MECRTPPRRGHRFVHLHFVALSCANIILLLITLRLRLKSATLRGKYMANKKAPKRLKRRRPSKKLVQKEKRGTHYLECKVCGDEQLMPASASGFTCSDCVTKMMPSPKLPKPETGLRADLKKARRARRKKIRDAELAGKKPPKIAKVPKLPRGWHRRKLFEITVSGKTRYYTEGKEVSQKEYEQIRDDPDGPGGENNHTGYGRGWHLKKKFVAPDGTVYSYGKKVK